MAVLVSEILELRTLAPFSNAEEFYNILKKIEWIKIKTHNKNKFELITDSTIFKITGYGTLNEAVSKITIVVDMKNYTSKKQHLYYREE